MSTVSSGSTQDLDDLRARAGKGDKDAMLRLFAALDRAGQDQEGTSWLLKLAQAGHVPSATLLGERLIIGLKAPQRPDDGARWIEGASGAGYPEALRRYSILAAIGIGRKQSWDDALKLLQAAAKAGHAQSASQLGFLEKLGITSAADIASFLQPMETVVKVASPRIVMAEGLLPEMMCRWLIERARPKLARAPVFAPSGGNQAHDIRTNSAAGFSLFETDLVIQLARARVAAAVGSPVLHQEPPQVLHYAPGERYTPHWDYFDPTIEAYRQNMEWGGQRIRTALVYLNSEFEDGETGFIKLGRGFRAGTGGLLAFDNVDAEGKVDHRTLHEGRETSNGEKWLLSVWIRDRDHVPA